ncbi:uncharacterized protein V6R79_017409 [Siganus canaliculatus]
MGTDLHRRDSRGAFHHDEENGYLRAQQSLRSRQVSSRVANQSYAQFSWSPMPPEEDEVDGSQAPRDFRSLTLPLHMRRHMRQGQQNKGPVASTTNSWKRKQAKVLRKVKDVATKVLSFFTLWRKTLQKIGGNFGGGVQSYFLFLRFLVILNFVSFLLIAAFVIIPSITFRSAGSSPINITVDAKCVEYNPNPQGLVVFYTYLLDLLSGTGFMEYSYLFYGYYNNTLVIDGGFSYNIPLAYLSTAAFYFVFCLICIIARMGMAFRVAVATEGSAVGNYSLLVFTGWDYGCMGGKATSLKQKNIRYQLQVDLEEESLNKKAAGLTLKQKFGLYSLRAAMSFLTLGLTGAAFYAIFLATKFSQENREAQGAQSLLFEYFPSIIITSVNFVAPTLLKQIAAVEHYGPSTTIILTLSRTVFLRLVSLGVLLYSLWEQITCEGDLDNAECRLCQYRYDEYQCWESRVGQEMYKLTLFDLLVNIAVLVLVEFPRRMVVDNCSNKATQWLGRQEFVVPGNVLGLVYGQTVVWIGAFFCPLLPLINTMKFVILFYCKKITLFQNCRPEERTFRSTTSSVFFLAVLVFGYSLATVVLVYSVAEMHPSAGCGPFRFFSTMWEIVPASFSELSVRTRDFLFFIGSQAFSIPLCALSFVVLSYFVILFTAHGNTIDLLRKQLKQESRDKQFLVKQIDMLSH